MVGRGTPQNIQKPRSYAKVASLGINRIPMAQAQSKIGNYKVKV